MSSIRIALYVLVLSTLGIHRAQAMAGTLKTPALAMSEGTSVELRTNLIAALSEPDCKFLNGNFINASTTLQYGGSTESLDHLISRLSSFEGIKVVVSFVNEPTGPSWIISHNAWSDPAQIYIKVNVGAPGFKPEQLQLPVASSKQAVR